MLKRNLVRARLENGENAIGIWVQTGSAAVVEIAGEVGLDFVLIDGEHGSFGFEHSVTLIRTAEAAGLTPVVRVPVGEPVDLGRYLDAGAGGLLIPQVRSGEHAHAIVSAAKYRTEKFPAGTRGACPITRATAYGSPNWKDYAEKANNSCLVWMLLETPEALDDLPAILDVSGIDGIMLGTHDLAVAMGYDGDRGHKDVLAKIEGVAAQIRAKGIEVIGSLDDSSPRAALLQHDTLTAEGTRIFMTASDGRVLFNSFRNLHTALRHGSCDNR